VTTINGQGHVVTDSYFQLVKQFPLTSIHDEDHHDQALGVIRELMGHNLDAGEKEYLDALVTMVEAFEGRLPDFPNASLPDVLHLLMDAHGETQATLAAKAAVPKSTVSQLLSGSRPMTLATAKKIAPILGVSFSLLLDCAEH